VVERVARARRARIVEMRSSESLVGDSRWNAWRRREYPVERMR